MKITNGKLIEILKENFYILNIISMHEDEEFQFVEPTNLGEDRYSVSLILACTDEYQSRVTFELDATDYDEKFSDIEEYEVEDMGVIISILQPFGEVETLNAENLWRELFYNKEKI